MKVIKLCLECKKEFESYDWANRKFCSRECSGYYNRSNFGNCQGKNNGHYNKPHTLESKRKISQSNKGKLLGNKNPSKRLKVRKKISKALKGRINTWCCKLKGQKRPNTSKSLILAYKEGRMNLNKYTNGYYRKDLKQYFRSNWEANYARILNYKKIDWKYEPEVFSLIIDNKEVTYRPDFYLPKTKKYIEIKGYWKEDSKKKYEKFAKTHKIILIDKESYQKLTKLYKNKIKKWEIAYGHKY